MFDGDRSSEPFRHCDFPFERIIVDELSVNDFDDMIDESFVADDEVVSGNPTEIVGRVQIIELRV